MFLNDKKGMYCLGSSQNIKLIKHYVGSCGEDVNLKNIRKGNMKRHNNLFKEICTLENLKEAHANARRDKKFYREVKMVNSNETYYLNTIREMLIKKTYNVSEYKTSTIDDKGKKRTLMKLPYFPDRIIQWAIMLKIEDILMKTFCSHTCASIKNRGINRASYLTEKYMKDKEHSKYCLKIDVSKFYTNINHEILKGLIRKKIKDKDLLELLDKIIDSTPGNKGIPIGSYLSQYFANFYLTYFDHWLKEQKKVKYLIRYMDDVVIFHKSKKFLHYLREEISWYLNKYLKLKLKENWQVFPTNLRGVDFVGYRHFYEYKLLRKSTCKRFKRKARKLKKKQDKKQMLNYSEWCSMNSYSGWLKHCNSYRLRKKYIQLIQNSLDNYYTNIIKRKKERNERHGNNTM